MMSERERERVDRRSTDSIVDVARGRRKPIKNFFVTATISCKCHI